MIWLLIACAGVVVILAAIAEAVASAERDEAKPLGKEIADALNKASAELDEAQNDDLGAPVITARMSGLVEFVHGLPSVRQAERRTNTVPFLIVLATSVVLAGATIGVVNRIEDRRERTVCAEALATLRPSPTSVPAGDQPPEVASGTAAGQAPDAAGAGVTTAPGTTASTEPAGTSVATLTTSSTTTTTTAGTRPTPIPATEASSFLDACMNGATDNAADDAHEDIRSKNDNGSGGRGTESRVK